MTTLDLSGLTAKLEGLGLGPVPEFADAHVLNKPLDIVRSYLAEILSSLTECDALNAFKSIHWPNDIFISDLTVPLPQLKHGADPDALAVDLMKRFPKCPLFMFPLHDGVHLRIIFSPESLPRLLLPYINDRKSSYGQDLSLGFRDPSSPDLGRKKVLVEFSSPNIASEFHGKHLRSTLLGAYIASQYETMGWDVVRLNYLGDWGKQIGLLGAGWEKFGSEEKFQADPIGHMLSVYNQTDELFQPEVAASRAARDSGGDTAGIEAQGLFAERNAFFKKMEDGDEETLAFWKRLRDVSIEHYVKLYARLNISFDEYDGEAHVSSETMAEVEDILKNKGITKESEGALIVDLKEHGEKSGRVIIRDRNGSRMYALRELASILDRSRKHNFDQMIYVVANDHDMHFSRTIKILKLMDMSDLADKLQHVHFNKGNDKHGHGHMLSDILNESQSSMLESLKSNPEKAALLGDSENSAAAIGISAILAQDLLARRAADHPLDISKTTTFGRGTGPELQYWYAKLCDIVKTAAPDVSVFSDDDFKPLEEEKHTELLRILAQYPNVTSAAYRNLEPSTIMVYLINVADQLPICLETEEGDESDLTLTPADVAFFETVRQVMENGMKLLGITPAAGVEDLSKAVNGLHINGSSET